MLVLYNAGPLDISWAKSSERVMAIVEHFFPAQTAGVALANILNGTYNPSGRLPNTWPASLDQVCRIRFTITKYSSTLYIGMDGVLVHYACTFENSNLHFYFQS